MPDHILDSGPLPAQRHTSGVYRVSLVCLGNICRSPTAEAVLREELARAGLSGQVDVDSSGTGDWHLGRPMDPRAQAELAARGYDGSGHRARQFRRSWFGDYDLVVAMDRRNLADLRRMAPDAETARDRIRLLRSFDPALVGHGAAGQRDRDRYGSDVPDPYNGSAADYALAFDLVQAAARGLAAQLAALVGLPADGGSPDGGSSAAGGNWPPGGGGAAGGGRAGGR
jgi:protein-tyrosine phosphatase